MQNICSCFQVSFQFTVPLNVSITAWHINLHGFKISYNAVNITLTLVNPKIDLTAELEILLTCVSIYEDRNAFENIRHFLLRRTLLSEFFYLCIHISTLQISQWIYTTTPSQYPIQKDIVSVLDEPSAWFQFSGNHMSTNTVYIVQQAHDQHININAQYKYTFTFYQYYKISEVNILKLLNRYNWSPIKSIKYNQIDCIRNDQHLTDHKEQGWEQKLTNTLHIAT